MKKMIVLIVTAAFVVSAIGLAWAGGDKVRGDEGLGAVNQVGFNAQDNQN